jgi:hypothetical protein
MPLGKNFVLRTLQGNRMLSDSRAPHLRQRHGFNLGANTASHCVPPDKSCAIVVTRVSFQKFPPLLLTV